MAQRDEASAEERVESAVGVLTVLARRGARVEIAERQLQAEVARLKGELADVRGPFEVSGDTSNFCATVADEDYGVLEAVERQLTGLRRRVEVLTRERDEARRASAISLPNVEAVGAWGNGNIFRVGGEDVYVAGAIGYAETTDGAWQQARRLRAIAEHLSAIDSRNRNEGRGR